MPIQPWFVQSAMLPRLLASWRNACMSVGIEPCPDASAQERSRTHTPVNDMA